MWKSRFAFGVAMLTSLPGQAGELTALETRWIQAIWPVVSFAKEARFSLDIVVQPQPAPGAAPLALAFVDSRCKLVLSMRGNPQAQATLDAIEPELLSATLELMAAHELGHCKRYLDGVWRGLPSGFTAGIPAEVGPEWQAAYLDMQAARREEGYADLVGLAWTQRHHPQQYARLHAWLVAERSTESIPGSHHDTLAWVRLARDATALADASLFAGADALWAAGLGAQD